MKRTNKMILRNPKKPKVKGHQTLRNPKGYPNIRGDRKRPIFYKKATTTKKRLVVLKCLLRRRVRLIDYFCTPNFMNKGL